MASRLVETVMINVDDFADSFLTCGTCFTGYDSSERAAKLLPCSHTICRSCLERILETQTQGTTFRCPICRENIPIPSGGAASFPPAFIVNQLLDLIATQRRDVVPKCRLHPNQELLFCETCDVVFCTECRGRSHVGQPFTSGPGTPVSRHCFDVHGTHGSSSLISDDMSIPLTRNSPASAALSHNVITFNVAIKRCTEIMLYKMHLCVQELNSAQDTVSAELDRLAVNRDNCIESINTKFKEIIALVERRQSELLDTVKRLAEDKHRALTDQLALIESERDAVRRECGNLKGIMDVRSISKAISYLNEKLDSVTSLTEPRENAFLRYQDCSSPNPRDSAVRIGRSACRLPKPQNVPSANADNVVTNQNRPETAPSERNDVGIQQAVAPTTQSATTRFGPTTSNPSVRGSSLIDIARCLAGFGSVLVSTTYPALCTARLPPQLIVYLFAKVIIHIVDYHGQPQSSSGTDPIEIRLSDSEGRSVPTDLFDLMDGTYELILRPVTPGLHQLSIKILSRPIRGSPFQLVVRRAQKRRWLLTEGADGHGLIQPVAVTYGSYPNENANSAQPSSSSPSPNLPSSGPPQYIYLLDTGNSRLLVIDPETGSLHTTLVGEPLVGQAATGITWSPTGLWIVNWRSKRIYLLDPRTDQVIQSIHSPRFIEPTSVCRCPSTGRLYVADNGAGCVFVCDPSTSSVESFIGPVPSVDGPPSPLPGNSPALSDFSQLDSNLMKTSRRTLPASTMESRSCRGITGLCATDTGELVISTGSTVRIYSKDGQQIGVLVPPIVQNAPIRARMLTLPSGSGSAGPNYPNDSPTGSTFTLSVTCENPTNLSGINVNADRFSLSRVQPPTAEYHSSPQRTSSVFPRGQFGGVFIAKQSGNSENDGLTDHLGTCLLATYSDRRRSGVFVWPEAAWSSCLSSKSGPCQPSSPLYDNGAPSPGDSTSEQLSSVDLVRDGLLSDICFQPYLVEADPSLRRLAGLVALPNCSRQLVVVDQGAQSLCRIRYA
ncbi:unnamed protein product [Calicophoron daubneyi]|uniref:RING-type domain-containing protein n=1 Tax=Calicophoron daubneyi TaxID=300641 RepID=A0AAV2TDB3_CALDB